MIPVYLSSLQPGRGRALCTQREHWSALSLKVRLQPERGRDVAITIERALKQAPLDQPLITVVFSDDDASLVLSTAGVTG